MKRILTLVLTLMLLVSCFAPAAMAEDPVVIQFWSELGGEDLQYMIKLCDAFNAAQSEVRLEHAALGGDVLTKMRLALGDDDAMPELIRGSLELATYAEEGLIQPFDAVFAAYPDYDFDMADFTDGAVASNFYNEKVYGLTSEFPLWGTWVNKPLQEQYAPNVLDDGVITWDEIREIGAKLAVERPGTSTLCLNWNQNDMLFSYVEVGGERFDENGFVSLDKELYMESMVFPELYAAGYLWQEGEVKKDKFTLGDVMFYTGGTWDASFMRTLDFETLYVGLPVHNAEYGTLLTGGANGFMLPKRNYSDKELWAVGKFLHWFFENEILWAESGAVISYLPVINSAEYAALPQGPVGNVALSWFKIPSPYASISTNVQNSFNWDVVYGYVSEQDYVDSWEKQANDQIAATMQ